MPVRAANITWSGWDLSDVKRMNFDNADFTRFKLTPGDVLINEGSGSSKEVGKPAIWEGQIEDCCFQNTLVRVQPTLCTPEYLHYYLLYSALTERFVSQTQEVNIYHIGKEGLAKFPIPFAPRPEQEEIVDRIQSAFASLQLISTEHARAARLLLLYDRALLDKAFRGELIPQDPSDEPAAALLKRIRESGHTDAGRDRDFL